MIILRYCRIQKTNYGCDTIFEDGAVSSNRPTDDEDVKRAHDCGFDNPIDFILDHDLSHAFLAEKMFDAPSPILWEAAHGRELSKPATLYEERMISRWQKFANDLIPPLEPEWIAWCTEYKILKAGHIIMSDFETGLTTLQVASIQELRKILAGSHHTDLIVRKNGQEYHFQADWLRDALDRLYDGSPNWKHSFLFARRVIDKIVDRNLYKPKGAVPELLVHHLRKASELLLAEVNGGLDEEYAGELENLKRSQEVP